MLTSNDIGGEKFGVTAWVKDPVRISPSRGGGAWCKILFFWIPVYTEYTDKKENKIFLIYKEVQNGAVAKSYD